MKSRNFSLLAWFVLLASVVWLSPYWLTLAAMWRILSFVALLTATILILINYHLKNYGNFLNDDVAKELNPFSGDTSLLQDVLKWKSNFRRKIFLMGLLALAYVFAGVSACPHIGHVNELYLYVSGWTMVCLFVHEQVRTYLVVSALINELNQEYDISAQDAPKKGASGR